jgi:hypothetical protein
MKDLIIIVLLIATVLGAGILIGCAGNIKMPEFSPPPDTITASYLAGNIYRVIFGINLLAEGANCMANMFDNKLLADATSTFDIDGEAKKIVNALNKYLKPAADGNISTEELPIYMGKLFDSVKRETDVNKSIVDKIEAGFNTACKLFKQQKEIDDLIGEDLTEWVILMATTCELLHKKLSPEEVRT